jgi:hypothetical protein
MRDATLLEGALQYRSTWTRMCAATMLLFVVVGVCLSGAYVRSMAPALESARDSRGAGFAAWLSKDAEAAPFQEDIASARPESAPNLALTILGALGPVVGAVWGASVIGIEFGRRTVRTRAAHVGWAKSVGSKALVVAGGAIAFTLATPVLGFVSGLASWRLLLDSYDWLASAPSAAVPSLLPGMVLVAVGVVLYSLIAAAIALVTRSLPAGVIGGLAFPYVESWIGQWWLPQSAFGNLLRQTLAYHPGAVVNAPPVSSLPPAPWVSWVVLLGWLAIVLAVLLRVASVQEIE